MATKEKLIIVAKEKALKPFHGFISNNESNIKEIIDYFPKWNINDADRNWCAAFVYYCCIKAGFQIPYSPNECITCSLAGCGGWEEFAIGSPDIIYAKSNSGFIPKPGDIVIYDNVFINTEHDHIGIVLEVNNDSLTVAEGNIPNTNMSGIIVRKIDKHIRSYIRIPDNYFYTFKEKEQNSKSILFFFIIFFDLFS